MTGLVIETERLIIREFQLDDANAVFQFSTCPITTRFTGDGNRVKTLKDAQHIISNIWLKEYNAIGYSRLAVVEKHSGNVIGFCGIKYLNDEKINELGYRLLPQYWGMGLALEATTAVLLDTKNRLSLSNVYADINIKNLASIKLINKLGFKPINHFEDDGERYTRFAHTL